MLFSKSAIPTNSICCAFLLRGAAPISTTAGAPRRSMTPLFTLFDYPGAANL